MNSRKREKPYPSRQSPYSRPKRRRPLPPDADAVEDSSTSAAVDAGATKARNTVVVIGVPSDCSVLDLKSRFEVYGPISRTRMDSNGVAYVSFRSSDAAQSAVDAAQDPSFPITLNSIPVQVMRSSDPIPQWGIGNGRKDGLSSKLLRAELPLSRHGRGNKLSSAIVNPRNENYNNDDSKTDRNDDANNKGLKLQKDGVIGTGNSGSVKGGREIIAYDDIL